MEQRSALDSAFTSRLHATYMHAASSDCRAQASGIGVGVALSEELSRRERLDAVLFLLW
jgi:hypothetical protein